MAFTENEVAVCNQSLGRFGATNFTYADQTGVEYEKCNLYYTQTRNALQRSFNWPFASVRKALTADTTTPDFEWDYQYKLPLDFLRLKSLEEDEGYEGPTVRYAIEGNYLRTNYATANIRYIKKVIDPDDWDPLFTEYFILTLTKKLMNVLAGTKSPSLVEDINREWKEAKMRAKAVCREETDTSGHSAWNNARYGSGKV
jgi:hypothetical protein